MDKPTHVKPSLYAVYFHDMKVKAREYGYNLVIHGSLNRDMDLILIPWEKKTRSVNNLMKEFCRMLDGRETKRTIKPKPHGRVTRIINIHRGGYVGPFDGKKGFHEYKEDPQYYLDISIMPTTAEWEKSTGKR